MLAVSCGICRVFFVFGFKVDVAEVTSFEATLIFVDVTKDHTIVQVDLSEAAVANLEKGHPSEITLREDVEVAKYMTRFKKFLLKK